MNKVGRAFNKLILNKVYGIKTDLVPDFMLPINLEKIKFARTNKERIMQILTFEKPTFEINEELSLSPEVLSQRVNCVLEGVINTSETFLRAATPLNIDHENFNVNVINEQMIDVFGAVNESILNSRLVIDNRDNKKVLEFLKENNLEENAYTTKGIAIIKNEASLNEFKKFADLLDKDMSVLSNIPEERFMDGEYDKFISLYGPYILELKGRHLTDFLALLVDLNLENEKNKLELINLVISKTGIKLIERPYDEQARKEIFNYLDCSTDFIIDQFLSLDDSVDKISPFTKKERDEKGAKNTLYASLVSLHSLSDNYKSLLSGEFREKLDIFFGLEGYKQSPEEITDKVMSILNLIAVRFNISAREIEIEMFKVKDALRESYASNLTSISNSNLPRTLNEYQIEEIQYNGEPFSFLIHKVRKELFSGRISSSNKTLSSNMIDQTQLANIWRNNPLDTCNPNNYDIDDQCYNTISTVLATNNNIEAHNIGFDSVVLIYGDFPNENIMACNRQGNGKEATNPALWGEVSLIPFNDLKNQLETTDTINPWMGSGEVVIARNKIVKQNDGIEKVDNSQPFLKPSGILISGDRSPSNDEIRLAQAFGIPFVRINPKAYPLNIQEKRTPELSSVKGNKDFTKVVKYLNELENQLTDNGEILVQNVSVGMGK